MRMSDQIDKITPAFLAAQKAIDSVVKDQTGKIVTKAGASYEYKYSNLASVLDAVKEALNSNGISIVQTPTSDANGVTVETMLLHDSTQWFAESLFMPIGMNSPQAYGAAITYCRRYSLQSMVGLKAEDDDADAAMKKKENRPNTATQVAVDAFDEMPEDEQHYLQNLAIAVIDLVDNGDDGYGYLEKEKLALWSLLPSKVRSVLKKAQSEATQKKQVEAVRKFTPTELGGQA